MASLPAQAVYTSAPVAGPSGSHPVPHGLAQHAHAYAHDIPSLPPQQDRLPPIRNLPPFRELDFQPYSQPQPPGPASNSISTQSGQPPPPPPQATSAYGSGVQRARQHPPPQQQQQHHSYGQVQQQHIPDSPALAQGQVPAPGASAPGVGGRGRTSSSWGAPPQPPGIPRSPAPPHSAASSSAHGPGPGMMGAPPHSEYQQHHLPTPSSSTGMGGTGGLHGHGSMMSSQQTQSLKRQRSESLARGGSGGGGSAGAGSGLGGSGSSVSVSPAAGAPGRSPHPAYTPGPPSHTYPQAHLHSSHGPPPASPYAPMAVPPPAGQSAGSMSVNPSASPAMSQSHPHQPQQSHQPAYDYSAYQTHQPQHPQAPPPSYAQSRHTPIPSGMYGAPPPTPTPELSWQAAHHAGPSQVQQAAPPGPPPPPQGHPQAPAAVQAYPQHIQHQQPQQSPSYGRPTPAIASGGPGDTASTGRASAASAGSMSAAPPLSSSGLGGAFGGGPSSSAGTSSDYMAGAGTMSFSQPSSPSKNSSDLKEMYLRKIQENCRILYEFAQKHMGRQLPQPAPEEIQAMEHRASEVVELLEKLRDHIASGNSNTMLAPKLEESRAAGFAPQAESGRVPKRPWEDVSGDEDNFVSAGPYPQSTAYIATGEKVQSMAEKDMAIIRSKRATNTGSLSSAAAKGKYRKRSRATPPGKCHSCNIRETPEWRRGPDGARTLCNACGLHYAKLVRKRDKNLGPDGRPVVIDLEMLRASTRAANEKEKEKLEQQQQRQANGGAHQQNDPVKTQGQEPTLHSSPSISSMKTQILQSPQMQPQQHYQVQSHSAAGYQYPAIASAQEGAAGMPPPTTSVMAGSPLGQSHHESSGSAPPSWASSTARMYGHEQSQSFMRTSHSGR